MSPVILPSEISSTWMAQAANPPSGSTRYCPNAGEPFARYGLDSARAVGLAGEIAGELGLDLEATLFWDYPTVQSLAAYLAETHLTHDKAA